KRKGTHGSPVRPFHCARTRAHPAAVNSPTTKGLRSKTCSCSFISDDCSAQQGGIAVAQHHSAFSCLLASRRPETASQDKLAHAVPNDQPASTSLGQCTPR